jgi:cytochrome c peroxidase
MRHLQTTFVQLVTLGVLACAPEVELRTSALLDNLEGTATSHSTQGPINTSNEFHTPQGTNGRSCETCHLASDGWSITPNTANQLFNQSGGLHPLFNIIDANTPSSDVSTVAARRQSYSMLLQGKFLRLRTPPATREFDVVAANDPFNFGTTERLLFFRRPLPTANFKSHTVMWDGANTVGTNLRDGLIRQARGNVTGAQQGSPASDAVIFAMVDFELSLFHARQSLLLVGNLNAGGAQGGPLAHASQPLVNARFNLFDAWIGSLNVLRAQIARGQELFNNVNANGRSCRGCHNAANNGQNVNGILFDVGTSRPEYKKSDMAVYTLQNRTTGEQRQTTDWGRAGSTGLWSDVDRFKTPNLRGLASRAPYFHNGIAGSLHEVIQFYEEALDFQFNAVQEADLVAFLSAL